MNPKPLLVALGEEELDYLFAIFLRRRSRLRVCAPAPASRSNIARAVGTADHRLWLGLVGEYAAAKALRGFWSGLQCRGAPDVTLLNGQPVEVRTRRSHRSEVRVTSTDHPDLPVLLVTSEHDSEAQVHGWLFARDAQQPRFLKHFRPGRNDDFFAPAELLRPVSELIDLGRNEVLAKCFPPRTRRRKRPCTLLHA